MATSQPAPLLIDQGLVHQAFAGEQSRTAELKDSLKNAERPSQRMEAAEELSKGLYLQSREIKAALMLAATDDPAACVRAACIRCLAQQGVCDEEFTKLIAAAQNDKDESVREEAGYALKKVNRK